MFAFYTFLSSLYNCLCFVQFILLVILLGEVRKFLGEMLKISGGAKSFETLMSIFCHADSRYYDLVNTVKDLSTNNQLLYGFRVWMA